MRCLILAIDSLEYEIAKNFRHLKQKEFGKTVVPIMPSAEEPYTPIVWGSFITGLSPSEHQISSPITKWSDSILHNLSELWERGRKNFSLPDLTWIGDVLLSLGFKRTTYHTAHSWKNFKAKNISTIFDHAKKPIMISVPSYNEERINQYLRRRLLDVFENRISEDILEEEAQEIFNKQMQKTMDKLDEDWDLFMVHFFIVDVYGHMFPKYNLKFERLYKQLDNLAAKIERKMRDSLVLIVSDHGHRGGRHTPYGFYSSNEILGLHYPEITNFYKIILETLAC